VDEQDPLARSQNLVFERRSPDVCVFHPTRRLLAGRVLGDIETLSLRANAAASRV
jgi:hypothetical protein